MRLRRYAAAAGRRLAAERGYSLTEMLVVLAILCIVIGPLTQLFVSASTAQVDMTRRFEAQQDMRLALDKLRREIHCANEVALSNGSAGARPFDRRSGHARDYCPTNATGARRSLGVRRTSTGAGTDLLGGTPELAAVTNCAAPPAGVTERNAPTTYDRQDLQRLFAAGSRQAAFSGRSASTFPST